MGQASGVSGFFCSECKKLSDSQILRASEFLGLGFKDPRPTVRFRKRALWEMIGG